MEKEVYVTQSKNLRILVGPGKKKRGLDFIVYVKTRGGVAPLFISDPKGRPRHIEWVQLYRDFYQFASNKDELFSKEYLAPLPYEIATSAYIQPIEGTGVLPEPQIVHDLRFKRFLKTVSLRVGYYKPAPLDFIATLLELLFIQEETNYPDGVLHKLLPLMLKAELQGRLPKKAEQAGETPKSLHNAVTQIAEWKDKDEAKRLLKKWIELFPIQAHQGLDFLSKF